VGGKRQGSPPSDGAWHEGAGGLLLLAGARETGLLAALERAVPTATGCARLDQATSATRRMLLLTLLFLSAVGLRRTWDLRGYSGSGLALLTGRRQAYGYRHVERFLTAMAHAGGAARLTEALAAWTATLWSGRPLLAGTPPPAFYVDGHRKAVYSGDLIPRGLVARQGAVLGCRALVLLHDAQGHPLLATTHRGDLHLTAGLPGIVTCYEQATGLRSLGCIIVDREGMAAEFLARLAAEGRTVITVLRADQHKGLASFTDVGSFAPFLYDQAGTVVREVAPARIALARPDQPGETLLLCVALVRDLRHPGLRVQAGEDTRGDDPPDGDRRVPAWWQEEWVATPTPAPATEPRLIPIVTTASAWEAADLARTYFHRWPAQENAIRDFLIPLGIDTNHGYAKVPVVNSEVAKRRTALQKRLETLQRWAEGARVRSKQAATRAETLWTRGKARADALRRALTTRRRALEDQGLYPSPVHDALHEAEEAAQAEVEGLRRRMHRARDASARDWEKRRHYCQEQRDLLRALEDLTSGERPMYELDNAKDQTMTVCKVALANLAMWVRTTYFPAEYAQATWLRLAPFFRLPGRVTWGPDTVCVELRPFTDHQMARDLAAVCARVAEARPQLPDGRHLVLTVHGVRRPTLDGQKQEVA
jgi:hypothetical protein